MAREVRLERLETGDDGTFGRILFDGRELHTIELPDRGNQPNISCIPAGAYRVDWTYSPAFKRMMYLVRSVPGRSGIRIHPANLAGDRQFGLRSHLYGCIALGRRRGTLGRPPQRAVLISRPAVREFEDAMQRKAFDLEIC